MTTRFFNYLVSLRGYSPRTAYGYLSDLKTFSGWLSANRTHADFLSVTREDLDEYLTARCAEGCKPATTNRELASISAFYRYLRREGVINENPAQYESRRKVGLHQPNTIPPEDLRKAYNNASGLARILLGLFMTTGLRTCEVLAMKWEDINFSLCSIRLHGKGNKERDVYTTSDVLAPLAQAWREKQPKGVIFRIAERRLRRVIYWALQPYSTAKQLSPHAIRHTFATEVARQGVNTSTLASMLGHNRLETTQHYIDMAQNDTKQAFIAFNMLNPNNM